MKPLSVCVAFISLGLAVEAVAMRPAPAVKLPVYEKPVTFFKEGTAALDLGPLPKGVASLSAEACLRCHTSEHKDWRASAHARSVTEPVFQAAFHSEPRFLCRSCHSPLIDQHPTLGAPFQATPPVTGPGPASAPETALSLPQSTISNVDPERKPNPRFNEALVKEGVTCVTCHVREGTILSSHATSTANVPHALSYSPALNKSEFCAGCHQFDVKNPSVHAFETQLIPGQAGASQAAQPAGATPDSKPASPGLDDLPIQPEPSFASRYQQEPRLQHTWDEWKLSPAAQQGKTCQSCHMPESGPARRHNWEGRNSLTMLQSAITLKARLDRPAYTAGEKLQAMISVRNSAGHRFPTGDSLHAGVVEICLHDGPKVIKRELFVMTNLHSGQIGFGMNGLRDNVDGRFGGLGSGRIDTAAIPPGGGMGAGFGGGFGLQSAASSVDTRLLPGEEKLLAFEQPLDAALAGAKELSLRVRVLHAAIHPGLKGSGIDPKLSPPQVVRQLELPVRFGPEPAATAERKPAPALAQRK